MQIDDGDRSFRHFWDARERHRINSSDVGHGSRNRDRLTLNDGTNEAVCQGDGLFMPFNCIASGTSPCLLVRLFLKDASDDYFYTEI